MIERKCQACNKKQDRNQMIKITKLGNILKINPTSKEMGRSIYVCQNENCIKTLIKKKRIKTSLKYGNADEIQRVEKELLQLI